MAKKKDELNSDTDIANIDDFGKRTRDTCNAYNVILLLFVIRIDRNQIVFKAYNIFNKMTCKSEFLFFNTLKVPFQRSRHIYINLNENIYVMPVSLEWNSSNS